MKLYSSSSVRKVVIQSHQDLALLPSSAADSSNTSFETSSKVFSRSRKIVAGRDLYPLLRAVIRSAMCIWVPIVSIVPTPLLKPREYGLTGWEDHLTLTSTSRSITFEKLEVVKWDDAFCHSLGTL